MSSSSSLLVRLWRKLVPAKPRPAKPEPLNPPSPPSPAAARARRSTIEPLEGRIAPAILLAGGQNLTYTDVAGDKVTIHFSEPIFGKNSTSTDGVLANVFTFTGGSAHTGAVNTNQDVPQDLEMIDLTQIPLVNGVSPAEGVSISIEVTGLPKGQSATVNVGAINATNIALGSVTIGGNLGYITAGDNVHPVGLLALNVDSLGTHGGTQVATTPTYTSTITGKLGSLTAESVVGAYVDVVNAPSGFSTTPIVGSIGSINIQTSLAASSNTTALTDDGTIQSAGNIGSIIIGSGHHGTLAAPGDGLIGGAGDESGGILSGGTIGSVVIKGDLIGSKGIGSGAVSSAGKFGSITLLGSLEGGAGNDSGSVQSGGNLGPVLIGTKSAGGIMGGGGDSSGYVSSVGNMGAVKITGNIMGGAGTNSGGLESMGNMGAVSVSGSVTGGTTGTATLDGFVQSEGLMGAVNLGSLVGGAAAHSGVIVSAGAIPSISITGQVLGGAGDFSGVVAGSLGSNVGVTSVKIGDGVKGGAGAESGVIDIGGALGSISIKRLPSGTDPTEAIIGDAGAYSGAVIVDGSIGSATIGGSIVGGSGQDSGSINGIGDIKSVSAGAVMGGSGKYSGTIFSSEYQAPAQSVAGYLGNISIKSLQGGSGSGSGGLISDGNIGSVKISGVMASETVTGGGISGVIVAGAGTLAPGNIGSVTVGSLGVAAVTSASTTTPAQAGGTILANGSLQSLTAGQLFDAAVRVGGKLGSLIVSGNVAGSTVTALALPPAGATTDLAISSISVGKNVTGTSFLAGYDTTGVAVNGHAQIGAVKVSGDWTASNLIAGVQNSGGNGFGAISDAPIGVTSDLNVVSRIASVVIGGTVTGSATAGTNYGFEASEIGSFQYGKTKLALNPATSGQSFPIDTTSASGVTVREVQAPVLAITSIEGGTGGVQPGQDVVLTIKYQNQGNQNAENSVVISITLPAGAQPDAANAALGWKDTGTTDSNGAEIYSLTIPSLAVKAGSQPYVGSVNFGFTVGSSVSATAEALPITASITTTQYTNGAGQPAKPAAVSEAIPLNAKPVLAITSVGDGATGVTPGQELVFTIDYQNQGNQDAQGVVLSATLPAGTTFDSADSTMGWKDSGTQDSNGDEIYNLAVGALSAKSGSGQPTTGTATFAVSVDADVPATAVNVAVTASITAAYNPADTPFKTPSMVATTPLTASPVLQITGLSDGVTTVNPGDQVTYTIGYTNTGNQDAQQVVIAANAPLGTTFNAAASASGWVDSGTQAADGSEIYHYAIPTLVGNGAGASQVAFAVTVNSSTTVTSIAETVTMTATYNTGEGPTTPPTQTLSTAVS